MTKVYWGSLEIKALRAMLDCTQAELAESLGVSARTVSQWETDKGVPSRMAVAALDRVHAEAPRQLSLFDFQAGPILHGPEREGDDRFDALDAAVIEALPGVIELAVLDPQRHGARMDFDVLGRYTSASEEDMDNWNGFDLRNIAAALDIPEKELLDLVSKAIQQS